VIRLVLSLPLDTVLVWRQSFGDIEQALALAGGLPPGFEIVPEDQVDLSKAILIPKEKPCKK
jgi:hypothetical protein